jgi:hypothetical protein
MQTCYTNLALIVFFLSITLSERIWPSRAVATFVRMLLRCNPPAVTPGTKLDCAFDGTVVAVSRDGGKSPRAGYVGRTQLLLEPHWRPSELQRVLSTFDRLVMLVGSNLFRYTRNQF